MEKLNCYLSIPGGFNAEKLKTALEQHNINVGVFDRYNYMEIVKADFVVALIMYRRIDAFNVTGISAVEKKQLLAVQNADYRHLEFLDRRGLVRCVIPHHKTVEIEKEILKFIKNKRIKSGSKTEIKRRLKELYGRK